MIFIEEWTCRLLARSLWFARPYWLTLFIIQMLGDQPFAAHPAIHSHVAGGDKLDVEGLAAGLRFFSGGAYKKSPINKEHE